MINVSDAFKNELNNDNRAYQNLINIVLKDGTELTLTNQHLWSGGVKLEESTSDSSNFSIGSCISSKLTITLNNCYGDFTDYVFDEATVRYRVGLVLPNNTTEYVDKGYFICTDASGQNSSLVTLECLDYIYKFNKSYSDVGTVYPATLKTIVQDICTACGVVLNTTNFPNWSYSVVNRPESDSLACADILSYVAQIACCWGKINASGQLVLAWYNPYDIMAYHKLITYDDGDFIQTKSGDYIAVLYPATDEELESGTDIATKVHRIEHTGSHTVALDDVVITGIKVSNKRDNDTVAALAGSEGYVLTIEDNPLVNAQSEGTVASLIGERCIGMTFRPLNVTCLSDPSMQAGDQIYFISPYDDSVYRSYITSLTFDLDGYETVACDAQSPARNSAKRYSELAKTNAALRADIAQQLSTIDQAIENLAGALATSSGLFMTTVEQPDHSIIYYMHDKPTLEGSMIIWKLTAEAFAISTDGGLTYPYGFTVDGQLITRLLYAEGINATYINAGDFVVKDNNNNIIFKASITDKTIYMNAPNVSIGGYGGQTSQSMTSALNSVYNSAIAELNQYKAVVDADLQNIHNQIDGQVVSWYESYDPTMSNAPAVNWTTDALKEEHEGDTFTNLTSGVSWRFVKENNVWQWSVITDTAAAQALALAGQAMAAADGKVRCFTGQYPEPPYDKGDLWINPTTGKLYSCINDKAEGQSYASTDWEEKVSYTDDTRANQAYALAEQAQALNVILSNDYDSIPTDSNGNYTTFPSGIQTTAQAFLGHTNITSQCVFTVTTSTGITGTWDSNAKTYTVTGLTVDQGWVDIQATYLNTITATKRFTIAKLKAGAKGATGATGATGPQGATGSAGTPGRVFIVEPSVSVGTKNNSGAINPQTITFTGYYRDGQGARNTYLGRFKIQESTDGATWTDVYTSSADENSCQYCTEAFLVTKASPQANIVTKGSGAFLVGGHTEAVMVKCIMYASGGTTQVLDQQTVPFVGEGAGLTIILSNETVSITAETDGSIPNYSECFTDIQVFYGNLNVSAYATYSATKSSGVTGSLNTTSRRYSVTNLSTDDGWVDITVTYKGITAVRRFTISKSKDGLSMTGVVELYALNNNSSTAPADSAFTSGVKTPTSSNRYLWNMETIQYSDGSSEKKDKHLVAMYGATGSTGVGIQSIVDYYAINNSTTAPADSAFSTTVQAATSSNRYLWNYEKITYTNSTTSNTAKRIIGTYGERGATGATGSQGPQGATGATGATGQAAVRYYLELSTKELKITTNLAYKPTKVTIRLMSVTGNASPVNIIGKLTITEYKGGVATVTRAINAGTLQTLDYTPTQQQLDYIEFVMYDSAGSKILDKETVQCLVDYEALTQDDILGVLSSGTWQGIYSDGSGHYYLGFSYAHGGMLTLGGKNSNENGTLQLLNASDGVILTMNANGLTMLSGSINLNNKFIVTSGGDLTASSGTIGNIHIATDSLYSGSKSSYGSSNAGFYLDKDGKICIGNNTNYLKWDSTASSPSLEIKGNITATSGSIGGLTMLGDKIYSGSHSSYNSSSKGFCFESNGNFGMGDSNYYLRWNNSATTPTLEVKGNITSTSGAIGGWTIDGTKIKASRITLESAATNGASRVILGSSGEYYMDGNGNTLLYSVATTAFGAGDYNEVDRTGFGGNSSGFNSFVQSKFYSSVKLYNLSTVSSGGHLVFASDGATIAYLSSSSKRYKIIDRKLDGRDVDLAYGLDVYNARYKDGYLAKGDPMVGRYMPMFIAEEVAEAFPAAVTYKDGQVEDWNYRVMIPIMFQMIKSQKEEIEHLKNLISKGA